MKKPTRTERFAQAAEDELPYAVQSGLTSTLIAGAQPQNAMVDRRIYQPPLASMDAQNPDPRLGRMELRNALSDLYAEPGRMLPGSGGWTEGMGAVAPHVAATALDLVNPASWAGLGGRSAQIAKDVSKQLPGAMNAVKRIAKEEHGTFGVNQPFDADHLKWLEQEQFVLNERYKATQTASETAKKRMQDTFMEPGRGNFEDHHFKKANDAWYAAMDRELLVRQQLRRIQTQLEKSIRAKNRQLGYQPSNELRNRLNDIGDEQ